MSSFAGAERAGERRRRRLAVESTDSESTLVRPTETGDISERFFAASTKESSRAAVRACPTLTVFASPLWKYFVVAGVGLAMTLALLACGYFQPPWLQSLGPGIGRLVRLSTRPVVNWLVTIGLFLTAQTTCIIWWARSRSLQDFHGQFRIWGWTAATWVFMSLSITTQAHLAISETVLTFVRWRTPGAQLWCWLIPSAFWGWWLVLRLEPELRANRSGHWVFLTAVTWYLGTAAILCQRQSWPQLIEAELSAVLLILLPLFGHVCLFLSMSLHTRFVLYFTAEPPLKSRRQASLKPVDDQPSSKVSRWLSLFSYRRSIPAQAEPAMSEEEEKPKKTRKRAASTSTKKKPARRPSPKATEIEEAEVEEVPANSETEGEDPGLSESGTVESEATQVAESWSESNWQATETPENGDRKYRFDSAIETNEDDSDENEQFKGLSKRERRKLQQQMKEQDRRGRK